MHAESLGVLGAAAMQMVMQSAHVSSGINPAPLDEKVMQSTMSIVACAGDDDVICKRWQSSITKLARVYP